jgi:hypothetical protein
LDREIMTELFLSASVPEPGRGPYYDTADPFLIQVAVRELVIATIRHSVLVWGGHPAITPMVWAVCEDLGVDYARSAILYQSGFFADFFPEENKKFGNVVIVPAVSGDREASLHRLRKEMLSRPSLKVAVFIGGMDGVLSEFHLWREYHPDGFSLALGAPGGAARDLALRLGDEDTPLTSVDFAYIYQTKLLPHLL